MKILWGEPANVYACMFKDSIEKYGYEIECITSIDHVLLSIYNNEIEKREFDLYCLNYEIFKIHEKLVESFSELKERIIIYGVEANALKLFEGWNVVSANDEMTDLVRTIRKASNIH